MLQNCLERVDANNRDLGEMIAIRQEKSHQLPFNTFIITSLDIRLDILKLCPERTFLLIHHHAVMSNPPLLLVNVPLPLLSWSQLISTCRQLILNDGDWLFFSSSTEFVAVQLNNRSKPLSQTKSLIQET